jgi:DNA modification methylase
MNLWPRDEQDGAAVQLLTGDSLALLPTLADASVDAIVTDPPYELDLMNLKWDASGIAYSVELWRECLRVLKPGGHLLAFGSPRTYHRMAVAIEDAGFEIRDSIHWIYSNGFPKGTDISKSIDRRRYDREDVLRVTQFVREARDRSGKTNAQIDAQLGTRGMAGHFTSQNQPAVPRLEQWQILKSFLGFGDEMDAEVARLCERKGKLGEAWEQRAITGHHHEPPPANQWSSRYEAGKPATPAKVRRDEPASDAAREWQGWGTSLRPAHEPIVVARKRLVGSAANNVLQFRTGAFNLGACRIPATSDRPEGRLPTNVILGEAAASQLDETADVRNGASRFFYVPKASPRERRAGLDSDAPRHPTMKPVQLMRYLVRLVTPPGGVVLDPFTGSGSTGIAAVLEGMRFIGIEREAEYVRVASARINHWKGEEDNERRAA